MRANGVNSSPPPKGVARDLQVHAPGTSESLAARRSGCHTAAPLSLSQQLTLCVRSVQSLDITSQLKAEWQRSGINFRVMLVGESGLGKSTFTRALFRPYVPEQQLADGEHLAQQARDPIRGRTNEITEIVHQIENDGYPVEFTIVDCPGPYSRSERPRAASAAAQNVAAAVVTWLAPQSPGLRAHMRAVLRRAGSAVPIPPGSRPTR